MTKEESGRRLYVTNLGDIKEQIVLVEKWLRGDATPSLTLKELVLQGMEATKSERTRLVTIHSKLWDCTFEQAWLKIVTGHATKIDMSNLSEQEYQKIYDLLGNNEED
jgi:hypothetical protein